jgi:hypothetical protein
MAACASWGRPEGSKTTGLCAACLRALPREEMPLEAHRRARSGHPGLVKQEAELSSASGGTVKLDLKAFHANLRPLSRVDIGNLQLL